MLQDLSQGSYQIAAVHQAWEELGAITTGMHPSRLGCSVTELKCRGDHMLPFVRSEAAT